MHRSLGMGKRPLSCLREGNQYTEHKTFRVGSEGAASAPGRCLAAPRWGLFGTAGGPTGSPHLMGAMQGGGCCCPSPEVRHGGCQLGGTSGTQDFHRTDPSLRAGDGPAVMRAREELQHPRIPARAVPISSRSHPYPCRQQLGPIPLQGAGAEGWATAPLLSCSGLRGTTLVLSGRANVVLGTSSGLQARQVWCYRLS